MKDGRSLSHKTLEEIRIQAVKSVLSGESPEVVIKALGMSRPRIYEWLSLYEKEGFEGLKAKEIPGRPPKLSEEQSNEIQNIILNKTPIELGFKYALWTLKIISQLIQQKYGITLSKTSSGRLMHKWGLSSQKPLNRAYQQDQNHVEQWKEKDFPEIKKRAKKENAQIYFEDESSVRTDHYRGRTWGLKGKRPVVRSKWTKHKINMISAISPHGKIRFMLTKKNVTSVEFLIFLKRLVHNAEHKIFLVLDGHPIHKSKSVKSFVQANSDRIELFFLPPYSPELNPDELVWSDVKSNIGRTRVDTFNELRSEISRRLRVLQLLPNKIASFFRHPDTKYILNES